MKEAEKARRIELVLRIRNVRRLRLDFMVISLDSVVFVALGKVAIRCSKCCSGDGCKKSSD